MSDISTAKPKSKASAELEMPKFEIPRFEMPKFEVPKFEVPAAFREFAEKSVSQCKDNWEKMKAATEEATGVIEDSYATASKGCSDYGLKVIGAVIPGLSTEREPSTRELANLVTAVKKSGAKVILTENTVNTRLAQTLARETGARIAPPLYTDALGPQGSAGETYLKALKYNVATVVRALR